MVLPEAGRRAEGFFPVACNASCPAWRVCHPELVEGQSLPYGRTAHAEITEGRPYALKIIYTRGNRTETLASIATLKKILNRFLAHRVFYEVSSRNKRGHEFFSAKNTFVVGSIEIVNRDYLTITIFDANNPSHSIEILNPAAMRIYDDTLGKGFAVSFLSEGSGGVESRCYLRDEGEDGDGIKSRNELEKITLPQLFESLEDILHTDAIGTNTL